MQREHQIALAGAAGAEVLDFYLQRTPEDPDKAAELAAEAGWRFLEKLLAKAPKPKPPPRKKATKKPAKAKEPPAKEPPAEGGDGKE